MAGDERRSARCDTAMWSLAAVAASGNTHRSRGTPSDRARSTDVTMRPAACSTALLEFITFVYGQQIHRLVGPGVRIWVGVSGSRSHACGLSAATRENRAHSSPRWVR